MDRFLIDFPSQLGSPNPPKIKQKLLPRSCPLLISFLDTSPIDFWSQLRAPNPDFSSPRCSHNTVSQKSHFEVDLDFCFALWPNWLHYPSQNPTKSFPKPIPKHIRISIDLWTDFNAMLIPFWNEIRNHFGDFFDQKTTQVPQNPPRPAQNLPRPPNPP